MNMLKNKINILLQCLIALAVWPFMACDDTMDGAADGTVTSLEFPKDTLIVASPGETVTITFDVDHNWKITSNKEWCLVEGEKTKYTSGKLGANSVKYVIGNPDDLYTGDEAVVTMTMEGTSSEIARIVCRPTKEYGIFVKDKDRVYANGESIIIGTSGELELSIDSPFKIEELGYQFPTEWLDVQVGEATMTLKVKESLKRYSFANENDSLCLFKEGAFRSGFHVQYEGMDSLVAIIEGHLENLVVSRDGQRAYVNDVRKEMPVAFSIAALNDEYRIMSWAYDKVEGYSILADEDRWFGLTDDSKGNISLSVTEENTGKDRIVALWGFPRVVADSLEEEGFENSLYEETDEGWAIKEDARQYLLTQLTQYGSTNITIEPEAQWGLKVAVDGKTYTTSTLSDTLDAPLKAIITTDNGYQLLYVNYDNEKGCEIISEADSWLDVTDDKQGNIEVRFDRNDGNMRTAYLLALPVAIAEDEEKLALELFVETEGRMEVRDDAVKFVVAQFIQDAEEESSMKVIDTHGSWKYLPIKKETDEKWLNIAASKGVSPKKVFRTELVNGTSYALNALISKEIWCPGDVERNDRIEVYSESGHKYTQGKIQSGDDFEAEPFEDKELEGDYMLLQFNTSYNIPLDECYIIYFVNSDDVYLKALVVWNYFNED